MHFLNLIKPYIKNSSWIALEHLIKIGTSIISLGMIASHYGTAQFGLLSYGLAIVGILTPVARLGLESVLVVQISNHTSDFRKYIGNAWWMMFISSSLLIISCGALTLLLNAEPVNRNVIIASICSIAFISFLVFDSYFQAIVQYKLSSIAKITSLLVGVFIKVLLIKHNVDLIWICASFILDNILLGLSLLLIYLKQTGDLNCLRPSQIDSELMQSLLTQSWPMIISGLSGILLSRLDQIMIEYYLGSSNLGIYAACARVYEGWISLTFMYSVATLPLLIKISKRPLDESLRPLSGLFAVPLLASIFFSLGLSICAAPILSFVFGHAYATGATTLQVLGICSIFASLGYMSARFLIVAGKQKKIAQRNVLAIIMNAALNMLCIPTYGIIGAAWATLFTLFFVHFVLDYLSPELATLKQIKQHIFLLKFWK